MAQETNKLWKPDKNVRKLLRHGDKKVKEFTDRSVDHLDAKRLHAKPLKSP
jgi:hypothetical protein